MTVLGPNRVLLMLAELEALDLVQLAAMVDLDIDFQQHLEIPLQQ